MQSEGRSRPRRGLGGRALAGVAGIIALAVSACGEPTVDLPAHGLGPHIDSTAFEGTLRRDGACLWLDVDGLGLNLLWPDGYRMGLRTGEVRTGDGAAIARVGDDVRIGGLPVEEATAPDDCPVRRAAAVGLIVEVNGVRVAPTDKRQQPTGGANVR